MPRRGVRRSARLAGRVQAVLDELLPAYPDDTLLLVAHGGTLQVLICLALGLPPEKYWQFHLSPGSLSEIAVYPQGGILNLLNEEFLPQIDTDPGTARPGQCEHGWEEMKTSEHPLRRLICTSHRQSWYYLRKVRVRIVNLAKGTQ